MNPLQPYDAFGTTHVAALLLLGLDALAHDVRVMTTGIAPDAFRQPDELDYALAGICALGAHVSGFAEPHGDSHPRPTGGSIWPSSDRALR